MMLLALWARNGSLCHRHSPTHRSRGGISPFVFGSRRDIQFGNRQAGPVVKAKVLFALASHERGKYGQQREYAQGGN